MQSIRTGHFIDSGQPTRRQEKVAKERALSRFIKGSFAHLSAPLVQWLTELLCRIKIFSTETQIHSVRVPQGPQVQTSREFSFSYNLKLKSFIHCTIVEIKSFPEENNSLVNRKFIPVGHQQSSGDPSDIYRG